MLRLRFAPSPTGYLHVGGARTALFNWLYARHYGGQFLLRVEDTDRARSTDESMRAIFEGLEWLGLTWDEDVVHQGANLVRHQSDVRRLLESGHAYRCFCTARELDDMRSAAEARSEAFRYDRRCLALSPVQVQARMDAGDSFVVRFRMPEGETSWDDLVHGTITFPNQDIGEGDFIILRSDGTPIYNMAVVSDDIAMRITLVMRGDDHISNTPKQILLYRALGAELPRFAHLPMIHGTDGKKLSKRHGATAVADYQHMGILPEAMLNFLALLGWSPGNDLEVMSVDEMIAHFSEDGLLRKASVFDPKKLEWMNGQHIARKSPEELEPLLSAALVRAGHDSPEGLARRREWLLELIEQLKVRSRTIEEMVWQALPFLGETVEYDQDAVSKQWKDPSATAEILAAVREALSGVANWDVATLEEALRSLAEARGASSGKIFQPLRVAMTGRSVSPGIFEVLVLLGRERSLRRLDHAIEHLSGKASY